MHVLDVLPMNSKLTPAEAVRAGTFVRPLPAVTSCGCAPERLVRDETVFSGPTVRLKSGEHLLQEGLCSEHTLHTGFELKT